MTVLVRRGVAKSGTSLSWQKRLRTAGGRQVLVAQRRHAGEEGGPRLVAAKTVVDAQGVVRDERGGPRRRGEPSHTFGPHALAHLDRRVHEVVDAARGRVHGRRGVGFAPAAIVMFERRQDVAPPLRLLQRRPQRHDPSRQRRVVGLGDEVQHAVAGPDDHRDYAERRRPSPTSTLSPPTCTRVMSLPLTPMRM